MRVTVTGVPKARRQGVRRLDNGALQVAVAAAPERGRANEALIAALARHFAVPRSCIRIVLGGRARRKVVEISGV